MKKNLHFLLDFWKESKHPKPESWLKIVPRFLGVVLAFFLLEKVLFEITSIPFEAYSNEFIYWVVLKNIGKTIYIPIILLLSCLILRKRLLISWNFFQKGRKLCLFITVVALILAWLFSTYNYNYYFDQWHVYDRILLCVSAFLIFYRPIFILLFLTVLFPLIGQQEVIQLFSLAAPLLPIRILILFAVFLLIRISVKWFKIRDFIFMVGCLVGVHYFGSGIRKIISGFDWLLYDQINYLVPSMYGNGWLSCVDSNWISKATAFLGNFNFPLKLFTLSIEIGVLFLFFSLKWARYCLIGAIIMHMGIVLYSGIFFWMWSLILILTLFFFFNKRAINTDVVFNKKYFVLGFLLIALGQFWSRPVPLSWQDTPLNYTYKFYAETDKGRVQQLTPKFFSPYIFQFTTGRFKYLNDKPRLPILWGATDIPTSSYFRIPKSDNEIFQFEKENGKVFHNKRLANEFEAFVVRFVSNWNKSYSGENYMDYVQPPRLLLTFPTDLFPNGKERIVKVRAIEVTTYYSEEKGFREIRKKELMEITIPKE